MPGDIVRDQDLRALLGQIIAARPKQADEVDSNVALADRYAEALAALRHARERGAPKGGPRG
jgi:hypothetical protein